MSESHIDRLRVSIAATATALLMTLASVGAQSVPSTEAVRLRNALLIEAPSGQVGQWQPDSAPADFLEERRQVPPEVALAARAAAGSAGNGEFARAKALVAHLLASTNDSGGIRATSVLTTYRSIVEEGRGYCSDYIDVFIAMAHAVGIPVRSWAFSFDGFGGHGHVVAEIFDRARSQWIAIDVFNNVHPVAASDGKPLSVSEFRALFVSAENSVEFVPVGPGRVAYRNDAMLRDYYRNGIDQWYLWNGNNVVTRRDGPPYKMFGFAPVVAQFVSIGLGDHPAIIPVLTPANEKQIEHMLALGVWMQTVIALLGVLGLALLVQALLWIRAVRDSRRASPRDPSPWASAEARKGRHA